MTIFLVEILAILVVGIVTYIEIVRHHLSRKYKHIKGVRELPIIGSKYTLRPNSIADLPVFFNQVHFDKLTKIFIGPKLVFITSDADVLQQMFTGNTWIERPFFFDFFRLKYGIITSKYHLWKPVRKAINPAFSQRMSLSFISTFEKHFRNFSVELEKHVTSGKNFDINELSVDFGIKVILETNFGVTEVDKRFSGELFEHFEDSVSTRIFSPLLWSDRTYKYSSLARDDRKTDTMMREVFYTMFKEREKYWQNRPKNPDLVNGGRLFIDEIVQHAQSGQYKNEEDKQVLVENMITIFMAGYETAALTVSYAILLLAMHPEIDAKLEEEIFANYTPGEPITHEVLRNMTYMEMVIKETLRLYPPAPITARQSMQDTKLDKIGNIEKGTIIGVSYYNLHRWKDYWGEDANEFNPEHFSAENSAKRHPYAFLPFSGGPKTCVGYQYAMINIKVGLICLLSQFKFSTHRKMEDLEYKFSVTLKLANKHIVKAHHRIRSNE